LGFFSCAGLEILVIIGNFRVVIFPVVLCDRVIFPMVIFCFRCFGLVLLFFPGNWCCRLLVQAEMVKGEVVGVGVRWRCGGAASTWVAPGSVGVQPTQILAQR
jgi:hypothetical protein